MSKTRSIVRSALLAAALASTTWLLLADSAETCEVGPEDVHLQLTGECPAKIRIVRKDTECSGTLTSESMNLDVGSPGYADLGHVPALQGDIWFSYVRFVRADGVVLEHGSCRLADRRYTCSTGTSTATMSSTRTSTVGCAGTFEVLP